MRDLIFKGFAMKKYIKSSTSDNSNYQFQLVKSTYLGGNMVGAYGQLSDGTYFYGNDADCFVWFVDSNPEEMLKLDDYNWWPWLDEHSVREVSEAEGYKFWIDLYKYCKPDNILDYYPAYNEKTTKVDDFDYPYDRAIAELQELI